MALHHETEQDRAHRLADEYSAVAALYQHSDRRRWLDATDKARAWREFAYLAHLIPAVASV